MSVWADEDGATDQGGMTRSAAYQRVFHDHHIVADPDFTILGSQYRPMQHLVLARPA